MSFNASGADSTKNSTQPEDSSNQIEDGELVDEHGQAESSDNVQSSVTTTTASIPTIHNFAATSLTNSNYNFTPSALNVSASPNFSFDSDSPGLAIAEEDDADPSHQKQESKFSQPSATNSSTLRSSVSLPANAERDNCEMTASETGVEVRAKHLNTLDSSSTDQQEPTSKSGPTWSSHSPGTLQIDDRDADAERIDTTNQLENRATTNAESKSEPSMAASKLTAEVKPEPQQSAQFSIASQNAAVLSEPLIASAQFGLGVNANAINSSLIPMSQGPSNEVVQLMNEQAARELREKLEMEQRRQATANSSNLSTSTSNFENLRLSSSTGASVGTSSGPELGASSSSGSTGLKRREAYRWSSNLPIYAMSWSHKRYPDQRLRIACSSIRDGNELLKNTMSIIEFDEAAGELIERSQVFIGVPSCEIKFIPNEDASQPDLIASATRELRIYSYHSSHQEVVLESKLSPNKSYAYAGPLTSLDWNEIEPRMIGASSIDSTCTIWDVEVQESIAVVPPAPTTADQTRLKHKIQTQLIAHEQPVHDIAFSRLGSGREYFASCGADASVRLFDLRNLKNSTILYEHPEKNKLNRISWNKVEHAQFVVVPDSSSELIICDVRMPCRPVLKYDRHLKPVNSVDWAPHSASHLCSGSSDHQALIWQLQPDNEEPLLAYRSEGEITRIRWCSTYNHWIGISFSNSVEVLRV